MPPQAPKPRFSDGEKVLCYHGPLIYEAKCLKSQVRERQMKYFIHYNGWNKNWDEWVPESRVLKYTEANLQKQKELAKLTKTAKKTKKAKTPKIQIKKEPISDSEQTESAVPEKAVKPKVDKAKNEKRTSKAEAPAKREYKKVQIKKEPLSDIEELECSIPEKKVKAKVGKATKRAAAALSEPHAESSAAVEKKRKVERRKPLVEPKIKEEYVAKEVKIKFAQCLKEWLVDDNDLITRHDMLLNLPARVTVDHVIANYVKDAVSGKDLPKKRENTTIAVANQIREAFNVLLGNSLLYAFERQQYATVLAEYPNWSMCQIYGAIHLLRMLTVLGPMLSDLFPYEKDNASVAQYLNEFSEFMSRNESFFSVNDYIVASPAYHRLG